MEQDTVDLAVDLADDPQDVDARLAELAMSKEDRILAQAIRS